MSIIIKNINRFLYNSIFNFILKWTKICQKIHCGLVTSLQNSAHSQLILQIVYAYIPSSSALNSDVYLYIAISI
jgi:hypothetical protein